MHMYQTIPINTHTPQFILLRNIAMARFLTPDERCWLLQRQQRALRRKLERNQRANKAHAAFLEWRVYYLSAAWCVLWRGGEGGHISLNAHISQHIHLSTHHVHRFLMASCQDALVFWVPQIIHASLRGPFSNQATNGMRWSIIGDQSHNPLVILCTALIMLDTNARAHTRTHTQLLA